MEASTIQWKMLMQHTAKAANRIREIAGNFGAKLPTNFGLEHLTGLPKELMNKIVVKLVETKCTRLTRDGWEIHVLLMPALRLYLATGPRKVDLTAILSFSPRRQKDQVLRLLVSLISQQAADIEELSVVATGPFSSFSAIANAKLLKSLGKLRRLKVLRIEEICKIRLIDLIELCQNLPDLEFLHFTVSDLTHDQFDIKSDNIVEKMKSAMPKLQVFLFALNIIRDEEHNTALIRCLADNLPNLRVIHNFASIFSSSEDYESSNEIPRASGSSNLRHLKVKYDFDEDCTHLPSAYPLVTHLRIVWNRNAKPEEHNLTALLQLTHLESIEFLNVPHDIVHLFVDKFGPNLRAICVVHGQRFHESTNYSLGQLLALCPKLERLAFVANFKVDPEPIKFFSNLKEVRINFWGPYGHENTIRLTDILRAPNLEKIVFEGSCIDFQELRRVCTLIKEKKILRNLKTLQCANFFNTILHFQADYFKEIAAFIKCVAASVPTISVITFDLHQSRNGYATLARTLTNGKTTNDEINGITRFFANQNINSELIDSFVDEELIAILEDYSC